MASSFLSGFTRIVVGRLLEQGLIEVSEGTKAEVVAWVAARLASPGPTPSLVSTLSRALLSCPHVEELYADDEELKELITDLSF